MALRETIKRIINFLALATFVLMLFSTCKKDPPPREVDKITLDATTVDSVTYFSVLVSSSIYYPMGNSFASRGFCYATVPNPDMSHSVHDLGPTKFPVEFSALVTNLQAETKYFIRAYAIYGEGIAWGEQTDFTTLKPGKPRINTDVLKNITLNTAQCGGNIESDSGYAVTASGLCWNATGNPIQTDSHTSDGSAIGPFDTQITGLSPSTTYYVRAYATNSAGISYGNEQSFKTAEPWICGEVLTLTHNAGNTAPVTKMVSYGTTESNLSGSSKCWITQNLGADQQATSVADLTDASAGWYWQFDRKQGFEYVINTTLIPDNLWMYYSTLGGDWMPSNDPCSALLGGGWRLPTSTEWETANTSGGWVNPNAAFSSELKLHAAGVITHDSKLSYRGDSGAFWSSNTRRGSLAWYLDMHRGYCKINYEYKQIGHSIRCLKD